MSEEFTSIDPSKDVTPEEWLRLKDLVKYEEKLYKQGFRYIAGIDEAGRGPLAGPVVAAACILPRGLLIPGINDSKKLSPKKRAEIFSILTEDSRVIYGVGMVEHDEIDQINIYQATLKAMGMAVESLKHRPDALLVDGMPLRVESIHSEKIIKGDQLSQSIAAAAIIAKHTRDQIMLHYHSRFPEYFFNEHMGYLTPKHKEMLELIGPSPIHRMSFSPLKDKSLAKK